MGLASYRDLKVWQMSMDLTVETYRLSRQFPTDERFGLKSQIRNASVSIPSNIAEGYGRTHRGDYLRHLSISNGSLAEVETHLILAVKLEYLTKAQASKAWKMAQEIGKMLRRLMDSLNKER